MITIVVVLVHDPFYLINKLSLRLCFIFIYILKKRSLDGLQFVLEL